MEDKFPQVRLSAAEKENRKDRKEKKEADEEGSGIPQWVLTLVAVAIPTPPRAYP